MKQAFFIFFLLPSPQAALKSLKKEKNYTARTNRYMKYFFNASFILCGLCCFAMFISLSNEIELKELNGSEYMHSILSGDDREKFNTMMDPRANINEIYVPILSDLTMRVMTNFIELLYHLHKTNASEPCRDKAKAYINNSNKRFTYYRGIQNA